jgi:hypothetical protein
MTNPETPKAKTIAHFDFQPGAGPKEIAAAVREAEHRLVSDKAKAEEEKPNEPADNPAATTLAAVWESATQSLSDAVGAISEASATVADKAAELGAAGVEMTTDTAKQIAQTSVSVFSGMGLASAIEYLDDAIDQQAITSAISDAAEVVGDKLDQVTGKQLVEMLEAKLRRQDEYNDILATRLAEALQRIAAIEQRLQR